MFTDVSNNVDRSAAFAAFDRRARSGEKLTIVFLGGSLTWGSMATDPQVTSYRGRIADYFENEYPSGHFRFWDASIGGTTSQLAAFRLERDVLSRSPDLVFLDFTINDGAYDQPDPDRLASYESLVRRLIEAGVAVMQVILGVHLDLIPNPPARPLDAPHKEIGKAYSLPQADAVALAQSHVREGKATPQELWDNAGCHPGDAGYEIYARAAWAAYQDAVRNHVVCTAPPKMLHTDTYMTVNRWRMPAHSCLAPGWAPGVPGRNAIAYDFIASRWMDQLVIARREQESDPLPAPLRFTVQGKNIFLFGEATLKSGKYEVRIDGAEPKIFDPGYLARGGGWVDPEWIGPLRYFEILAIGLDPEKPHAVEIIPQLGPKQELRLESLCLAGSPASVVRRE